MNGILRGSFYVTVVTCDSWDVDGDGGKEGRERLRAIIEYKEEVSGMRLESFYFIELNICLLDSRG